MKKLHTLSDVILWAFSSENRSYEATETTRDRSVREMKYGPHRIKHRFPFKGGISFNQVLVYNVQHKNALYERLMRLK